jgi:hypothetical protein
MNKIFDWFLDNWLAWVFIAFAAVCWALATQGFNNGKQTQVLKEYKDGIQNHLAWNIKGECYFVRPNDDVTVYMIRVQDCDKK